MPVPASVEKLYKEFDSEYKKGGAKSEALCKQLKVEIAKASNQLLLDSQEAAFLLMARDVYERGAFLAIKKNDIAAFERNVKQLKIYYRDFDKQISTKSANEYKILGLYLLALLAADRIGEFHTELELVSHHDQEFIQRPVLLERYLMEGNYAKINSCVAQFSSQEYYPVFLEQLLGTMRRRILESLSSAASQSSSDDPTPAVSLERVAKMLYMKNGAELKTFLQKMQEERMDDEEAAWKIVGDSFQVVSDSGGHKIPALQTIAHVIDYATELERIV